MVRLEDANLEKMVLARESCIAVPFEIYVPNGRGPVITVYSFFEKCASEFESKFNEDLLSANALKWLDDKISATVKEIGYIHVKNPINHLCEFEIGKRVEIDRSAVLGKLEILEPGNRLEGVDSSYFDDVNFDDTVAAVCVVDDKIVSVALTNDIEFTDESVEISVETIPSYEGKGYGTAVVAELCNYYIERGVKVKYECAKTNDASVKIALKCGFDLLGERYSYVCYAIEEE